MVCGGDRGALVNHCEILMIAVALAKSRRPRKRGTGSQQGRGPSGANRKCEPTLHHIATRSQAKWLIADGTL
jgi:hypothetical protein